MTDIVDKRTRSRMMSRITGRDTRPERIVRSGLHRRGFRFSLHRRDLPGRPDLVLPAYRTVVFVNGCFWHCHDCDYFRLPKSNRKFWKQKLDGNRRRDETNRSELLDSGWYVAIVWECAIRDQRESAIAASIDRLAAWLRRDHYRRRLLQISSR